MGEDAFSRSSAIIADSEVFECVGEHDPVSAAVGLDGGFSGSYRWVRKLMQLLADILDRGGSVGLGFF